MTYWKHPSLKLTKNPTQQAKEEQKNIKNWIPGVQNLTARLLDSAAAAAAAAPPGLSIRGSTSSETARARDRERESRWRRCCVESKSREVDSRRGAVPSWGARGWMMTSAFAVCSTTFLVFFFLTSYSQHFVLANFYCLPPSHTMLPPNM